MCFQCVDPAWLSTVLGYNAEGKCLTHLELMVLFSDMSHPLGYIALVEWHSEWASVGGKPCQRMAHSWSFTEVLLDLFP